MGKYSQIRTGSLQTLVSDLSSDLIKHDISKLNSIVSDKNYFDTINSKEIIESLNKVNTSSTVVGSVSNIKKYITRLKKAIVYIQRYQTIEAEIRHLTQMLNSEQNNDIQINKKIMIYRSQLSEYERSIDQLLK